MTTDPQVDAEGRVVVLRREWPDPIDDVWSALTESERTARWIGTWTGRGGGRPGLRPDRPPSTWSSR